MHFYIHLNPLTALYSHLKYTHISFTSFKKSPLKLFDHILKSNLLFMWHTQGFA